MIVKEEKVKAYYIGKSFEHEGCKYVVDSFIDKDKFIAVSWLLRMKKEFFLPNAESVATSSKIEAVKPKSIASQYPVAGKNCQVSETVNSGWMNNHPNIDIGCGLGVARNGTVNWPINPNKAGWPPVDAPDGGFKIKGQGVKSDSGKPDYALLPALALDEVVKCLTFGAREHDSDDLDKEPNWKSVPFLKRRFFSAAQRHQWKWKGGSLRDTEEKGSGCHHLAAAITDLLFVLEKELEEGK